MKKSILFFALVLGITGSAWALVPDQNQVYTVFKSDGTLTYYFDDQMDSRTGAKEIYPPANENFTRFESYSDDITTVVIDPSMQNARLESMEFFFSGGSRYILRNPTSIVGLENLYTASVTNMNNMFYNCRSLTSLDLRSFNTSNVTTMVNMFKQCYSLTEIDVNSFKLSSLESIAMMFDYCEALTTIYCYNDWTKLYSLEHTTSMFRGCEALVGGKGTAYSEAHEDFTYARPDGGTNLPGYFTMGEISEGIDQVTNNQTPITNKILRDGILLIERNGKTYNATGAEVK